MSGRIRRRIGEMRRMIGGNKEDEREMRRMIGGMRRMIGE